MSDERVERIASIVYDAMPDDPFTKPMTSDGFELPYPYAYHIAATHYPDRKAVRKAREAAQKIVAELDEEPPLEDVPVEHQLSRGNMVMEWIVGDCTEGSNSLAGSAIVGMLDYCRAMGVTRLVVNQDAPNYDWSRMTQKEQKALLARVAEIRAAVRNAKDGA